MHSQRLNQISNEPPKVNEETNDHQRLNYISDNPSNENELTNDHDHDYCFMIRENKQNTLKISQGKVNGKRVEILIDTGCTFIIVNSKLLKK